MAQNEKHYLLANDYLRDVWQLAYKVRTSGWKPDKLIALWRGGAPVGVAVHEFLKTTGWTLEHIPLKCSSYSGIEQNWSDVQFSPDARPLERLRSGERVLIVDDVFDTGKTALAVKQRVAPTGADMRIACVYYKPLKNMTTLAPDYFVRDVGTEWIVFPHEIDGLDADEVSRKDPYLAELLAHTVSV